MPKTITKVTETPVKCVVCQGSGESITDKTKPCKACDGDGVNFITEEMTTTEKPDQVDLSVGDLLKNIATTYYNCNYETCPTCKGSGRVPNIPSLSDYWYNNVSTVMCTHCWGLGKVPKYYTPSIYPNYRPWWGNDWGYPDYKPYVTWCAADTYNYNSHPYKSHLINQNEI